MGYSEAQGTLINEKNLMSKISCQTPLMFYFYRTLAIIFTLVQSEKEYKMSV